MIYDETLCRKIKEGSGTDEEKLEVLRYDGTYLQYCTNATYEMKRVAVEQNGYAIKYVCNPSLELVEIAVKQSATYAGMIKKPTREQIETMLEIAPEAVRYIEDGVTEADWIRCIKKDTRLIRYIPRKCLTAEICTLVGESDYTRIKNIPESMIDEDMAFKFVKKSGLALQYLPEDVSDDIKILAISNNSEAAKFVKDINDLDKLMVCVNNDEKVIQYLNPTLLKRVAKKYRDDYLNRKFDC